MPAAEQPALLLDDAVTTEALLGVQLARARTERGLTIEAVAGQLLLSPRQVRALETGDVRAFHNERFYVRARQRYATLPHLSSTEQAPFAHEAPAPPSAREDGVPRLALAEDPPPPTFKTVEDAPSVPARLLAVVLVAALLLAGAFIL